MPDTCRALGVDVEQLGRRVARLLRGAFLAFPIGPTQRMQWCVFGAKCRCSARSGAGWTPARQLRLIGVFEVQELRSGPSPGRATQPGDSGQCRAPRAPRIADADLGEVLEHAVDIGRLCPFAPRLAVLLGYSSVSVTSEIFSARPARCPRRAAMRRQNGADDALNAAKSSTFVASNPCSVTSPPASATVPRPRRRAVSVRSAWRWPESRQWPERALFATINLRGGTPRAASLAPA